MIFAIELRSFGFKADHQRAIDHFIDYFGDGATTGIERGAEGDTSVAQLPVSNTNPEGSGRSLRF
jgi:hypothetical protein